jgi:hypothetical protein
MLMKLHQSISFFIILILSLLLSACQAAATPTLAPIPSPTATETSTPFPPTATATPPLSPEFYFAWYDWQIDETVQPTTTQDILDVEAAQEIVETYYHLLEEKKYAEAYALINPSKPNLKPLDEWVTDREIMLESLELLSVQHYPAFQATVAAGHDDGRTPTPFYESERCKVFVVKTNVNYIGGWGSEPSGESSTFVIAVKEKDEWYLAEFASGIGRDACRGY